jgi:hypothetical protein
MTKDTGKPALISAPPPLPLPNPAAGSANPGASLSALWGYVYPALDHIVRSPGGADDPTKAPAVDVGYHMGIHTATYNYFTAQSEQAASNYTPGSRSVSAAATKPDANAITAVSGLDLYGQLDKYYAGVAQELLLGAPQDDAALIHYILPCFNRYAVGAHAVNRLLNYVNRHLVKRAVDEDRGWLRLGDVLDSVAVADDTRVQISRKLRARRMEELKKWGYVDGGSAESMARAEACAEAASSLDRIVPVSSLAFRRFRTDFFEPLLAVPKLQGKGKARNRKALATNGEKAGPKGRLARAVKALLEAECGDEEERILRAGELANALKTVGVRTDHPLRRKLDRYVASTSMCGSS